MDPIVIGTERLATCWLASVRFQEDKLDILIWSEDARTEPQARLAAKQWLARHRHEVRDIAQNVLCVLHRLDLKKEVQLVG